MKINKILESHSIYYILISFFLLFEFLHGTDSYIIVHDNLDSVFAWSKLISSNGLNFKNYDFSIDYYVKGMSRVSFGSPLSLLSLLNTFLTTFQSYVVMVVLQRFIAFWGMRQLAFYFTGNRLVACYIGLCFSILPFWPYGVFSVAGVPFLFFIFLHSFDKRISFSNFLLLCLISWGSDFFLSTFFFLIATGLYYTYKVFKSKKIFFQAIGVLISVFTFSTLVYSHIFKFMMYPTFELIRSEFILSYFDYKWFIVNSLYKILFNNHYHAQSIHSFFYILIFFHVLFKVKIRNKLTFITLSVSLALFLLISQVRHTELFYYLTKVFPFLISFNIGRFVWLAPPIWWLLIALMLNNLLKVKRTLLSLLILPFAIFQVLIIVYFSNTLVEYRKSGITFKNFYQIESLSNFKSVTNISECYFGAVAMHPAVLQYNGLRTIDVYNSFSSISKKREFSKYIKDELNRSDKVKNYFNGYGARMYLFSSEIGLNFYSFDKSIKINKLNLDFEKLRKDGVCALISQLEILSLPKFDKFYKNESGDDLYIYFIK